MELNILVQGKDELDVEKVLDFIKEHDNRRFVLIYSALKDEMTRLNFLTSFIKENSDEFIACNVSGFMTQDGYYNDSVAVCVFCGDFEAEVFHVLIDFDNIKDTVEEINNMIDAHELFITYSANLVRENYNLEKILKRVQKAKPMTQIFGGVCSCSPPPLIATKEGVFTDALGGVLIKKIDHSFRVDTGFELDLDSIHEFTITKCDEDVIYEINERNAAQEFQRIQHVRDYLFNRVMDLVSNQDVMDVPKFFSRANEVINDVVTKSYKDMLANKSEHGFINIFSVTQIEQNKIRITNSRAQGTQLKKTKTTPEEQLATYDRLNKKYPNGKAMIISDCAMRPYYYEYNTTEAVNRIKKNQVPDHNTPRLG